MYVCIYIHICLYIFIYSFYHDNLKKPAMMVMVMICNFHPVFARPRHSQRLGRFGRHHPGSSDTFHGLAGVVKVARHSII